MAEVTAFKGMHSETDKFNMGAEQSPDCSCCRLDPIGELSKANAGYRKFLLSSLYTSGNSGITIHSQKTGGYYQHFVVDDGDSGRVVGIGDMVKDKVKLDEKGYIITDNDMRTSMEGIFACGDVRKKTLQQIVVATGEGAQAAIGAEKYVAELKGTAY